MRQGCVEGAAGIGEAAEMGQQHALVRQRQPGIDRRRTVEDRQSLGILSCEVQGEPIGAKQIRGL